MHAPMTTNLILAGLYNAVLVGTCAFAFVRGGRPERIGAAVCLLASYGTVAVRIMWPSQWLPAATLVLAIDIAVMATFLWLATSTIRFWPIWAAGFMLGNVAVTIAGAIFPHVHLFSFHTGLGAYAYLTLGVLGLGTYRLGAHPDPIVRNGSRKLWLQKQP